MKTRKRNKGFTLVEILIVVVILGILAAIVIPQFTQASTEAKEASLKSNLRVIRSQIELWKINNSDNPPATLDELRTGDGTKVYLRAVPVNPFNGFATEDGVAAASGLVGWSYVELTGEVSADDTGVCTDVAATPHSAL